MDYNFEATQHACLDDDVFLLPVGKLLLRSMDAGILTGGTAFFRERYEDDNLYFVCCRFRGFVDGRFWRGLACEKKGLEVGRGFMGMTGLGLCGFFILVAGLSPINNLTALC